MKFATYNIRSLIYFIIFFFCLLFGNSVQAVGVGVKPNEVSLDVKVGKQTETEILVVNVSNQPAFYQVYPDAMENEIKVLPADFRLESDESKIVKLEIKINTPGRFATNLSVVARPVISQGLPAGSGVKVPITIVVSGLSLWILILMVVVFVCLVVIFVVKLKKLKSNKNRNEIAS